jgi:hypothetical protein
MNPFEVMGLFCLISILWWAFCTYMDELYFYHLTYIYDGIKTEIVNDFVPTFISREDVKVPYSDDGLHSYTHGPLIEITDPRVSGFRTSIDVDGDQE